MTSGLSGLQSLLPGATVAAGAGGAPAAAAMAPAAAVASPAVADPSLAQQVGGAMGLNVDNEKLRKQLLGLAAGQQQPQMTPAAPVQFGGPQPGASLQAYLQNMLKGRAQ